MSAIGAFVFGFSLGYSSPTMAGNIAGQNKTLFVLPGSGSADGSHNETKPNNPVVRPNNPETDGMMNCDLWLSDDMVTWFGSLINLGCLGGALLGATTTKNGNDNCIIIQGERNIAKSIDQYIVKWDNSSSCNCT